MIFVEGLDRVGRKLKRSIMPDELGFFAELRLDLENVVLDAVFTLRLGLQTEALHASAGFVNHKQQVSAAAVRDLFHWPADVEV